MSLPGLGGRRDRGARDRARDEEVRRTRAALAKLPRRLRSEVVARFDCDGKTLTPFAVIGAAHGGMSAHLARAAFREGLSRLELYLGRR